MTSSRFGIDSDFTPGSSYQSSQSDGQLDAIDWASFRQSLATFSSFVAAAALMALLLAAVLWPVVGLQMAITVFVAVIVFTTSYRFPRGAIWLFFIYMPFAGTVVYWAGGGGPILQLAKDGFYLPAVAGLAMACRQQRQTFLKPKAMLPALWLLVAFCILSLAFVTVPQHLFNRGAGQPLLQGILGLKVLIGYIPLIFCMQIMLRTEKEFLFFARLHAVLAIICCSLCFIQYLKLRNGSCQGTDHLVGEALFKASISAKCFVGGSVLYSPSQGLIRLPGTFVAPWQWGWFLIANAYLTFAVAFADKSRFWRTLGFVGMAAVTITAVISGQRVALALVPVSFGILLVFTGQVVNFRRLLPIAIFGGVLGYFGWINNQELVTARINSFISRWEASPATDMIAHQFDFVWRAVRDDLLGHGLGTATNSTRIFNRAVLIETWWPKLLYELGVIGTLIFFLLVTVLSILAFQSYRVVRDKNLRIYAGCFWIFILFISYQTYYYPLDVDPVAVYYWALAGAVFQLPTLDRQLRRRQLLDKDFEDAKTTTNVPQALKRRQFASVRTAALGRE